MELYGKSEVETGRQWKVGCDADGSGLKAQGSGPYSRLLRRTPASVHWNQAVSLKP